MRPQYVRAPRRRSRRSTLGRSRSTSLLRNLAVGLSNACRDAVQNLNVGQTSGIVSDPEANALYILRVTDVFDAPKNAEGVVENITFAQLPADLQEMARSSAESQKSYAAYNEWLSGLRERADIKINAQGFNDGQYNGMDYHDIRFNQTDKYLYVTAMGWPEDGKLLIKSLAKGNKDFKKSITNVYLLGHGKLKARQTTEGLEVTLPQPCNQIVPVLRINK